MKSNTTEERVVFDMGSLYAHLQGLKDSRKPGGIRYQLVTILVLMKIALADKGCEILGAAKLLKMVDLREQVVMGDALHTSHRPLLSSLGFKKALDLQRC